MINDWNKIFSHGDNLVFLESFHLKLYLLVQQKTMPRILFSQEISFHRKCTIQMQDTMESKWYLQNILLE